MSKTNQVGCCVDAMVSPFQALDSRQNRRKIGRLSGIYLSSTPNKK